MAHPHNEHRAHKVERERVHHIAGVHEEVRGHHQRARGGRVHDDEAEDRALVSKMLEEHERKEMKVKGTLKHDMGKHAKQRADKAPRRARGGHVKKGGKGHTNVNVIVAPGGGGQRPMPLPVAAPPVPPRPPIAPPPVPALGGAPGPAPGLGGMPPRKRGGRVTSDVADVKHFHKGEKVEGGFHKHNKGAHEMHGKKSSGGRVDKMFGHADMDKAHPESNEDDWGSGKPRARGGKVEGKKSSADARGVTGIGARTPIQHSGNKSDTQNIGRGPVITKATGGPIYADGRAGKQMGPNVHAGNSGIGRLRKNALARREHWER